MSRIDIEDLEVRDEVVSAAGSHDHFVDAGSRRLQVPSTHHVGPEVEGVDGIAFVDHLDVKWGLSNAGVIEQIDRDAAC